VVAWFWEHDGHLIFKLGDISIENSDIKCSYGWRFL
jgi:predicted HAD superfamily hydrolase